MAFLVAFGLPGGEWEVVVMHRFHSGTLDSATDVLGRKLPEWERLEAREGVPKADCERLANQLKGMNRKDRYALFRRMAPDLKLRATYQPDPAAFNKSG